MDGDLVTPAGPGTSSPAGTARRGRLRRSLWLWVLAGGVAAYLLLLRTMVSTQNVNFFPSLLLVGAITVPMTVLVYAEASGRRLQAPAGLLAFVAVAGGVVGTLAAGVLEYDTLRALGTLPMLGVGLVEETAKVLVPLAVLVVTRPRDPRPGVTIGIAAGTGFASLETMGYGFQALLASRGNVAAVDDTLLLRGLLAPAGHVAWTGLVVAALWALPSAVAGGTAGRAFLRLLGAFTTAVALHALWDGTTRVLWHAVVAGVSIVVLLVLVTRAHRAGPPAG